MVRSELIGNLSHALPATQFNQNGQNSCFIQSNGAEFGYGELYYYSGFHSNDDTSAKQKQSVEIYVDWKEKVNNFFLWAGKQSLEIYMIHGLLLNIFKSKVAIQFSSIEGYLLTAGNFALTMGLCAVAIHLLNQNVILLRKILNIR